MIMHYIFISPHFDDICFSMSGFLHKIRNASIKKTLVNIYTISSYYENEDITNKIANYTKKEKINYISILRNIEDNFFCKKYNLDKINLDFVEASVRNLVWNLSDIENDVEFLRIALANLFKKIISKKEQIVVFAPMSIGYHRDHVVLNKVVKNFTNCDLLKNIILYEDIPYITYGRNRLNFFEENKCFLSKNNYKQIKLLLNKEELKAKSFNIKIYKSQLSTYEFENFNINKYVLLDNNNYIESLWKKL